MQTPSFNTEQEAVDWMVDEVDDPCIDNIRFAFADDEEALDQFDAQADEGCCGSFGCTVIVGGREAVVGCNFGH